MVYYDMMRLGFVLFFANILDTCILLFHLHGPNKLAVATVRLDLPWNATDHVHTQDLSSHLVCESISDIPHLYYTVCQPVSQETPLYQNRVRMWTDIVPIRMYMFMYEIGPGMVKDQVVYFMTSTIIKLP